MKFSITAATVVATGVSTTSALSISILYNGSNPVIESTCPVPSSAQPLGGVYPVANFLGSVVSPTLDLLVGKQVVEDIDAVADQLCVNAQQDPGSGDGICQDIFGAVRDFVDAKTTLSRSKQFGCLLDLICVANTGPQNEGTCNQLLAGADCIANRIIGVSNLECY